MQTSSGPASHCVRSRDNPAQSDGSGPIAARKAARTCAMTKEARAAAAFFAHSPHQLPGRKLIGHRSRWCDMLQDSSAVPSLALRPLCFDSTQAWQHDRVNDRRPRLLCRLSLLLFRFECRQKKFHKRLVRERVLTADQLAILKGVAPP